MKAILKAGLVMFTVVLCGTAFGQTQSTKPTPEQQQELKVRQQLLSKTKRNVIQQPPATTTAVPAGPHRRPEAVTMKQKSL